LICRIEETRNALAQLDRVTEVGAAQVKIHVLEEMKIQRVARKVGDLYLFTDRRRSTPFGAATIGNK
jgi:hypothetical protein